MNMYTRCRIKDINTTIIATATARIWWKINVINNDFFEEIEKTQNLCINILFYLTDCLVF